MPLIVPLEIIDRTSLEPFPQSIRSFSKHCPILNFELCAEDLFNAFYKFLQIFLSKCNPYFIMKFSDSALFFVNSIDGSPSTPSTQIGLIRNAFISCALTNFLKND